LAELIYLALPNLSDSMDYAKLVAVTGLPGLYELINSKTDGAIVRSLDDKTTRFVSTRMHNFSHLESIEVYTIHDNVNLVDVFHAMEKSGDSLPDVKDETAVKKYFQKAYPDLDFEKVYSSDLKKMLRWFDVLKKNNIDIKLSEPEAEPPVEEKIEEPEEKETPKKKTVPKAPRATAADSGKKAKK